MKLYACRYLGFMKHLMHNRARPEGSIAENYISNESLNFISRYLRGVETRLNRPQRIIDGTFYNDRGEDTRFPRMELDQAHTYILSNDTTFNIYTA